MTGREIYKGALALLFETEQTAGDYNTFALPLLNILLPELLGVNNQLRSIQGKEEMPAAPLLSSLEEACGSCDSLCEEFAYPDENAEAILQTVPAELLQKLRERGICMRQLARHLRKGDAVYGR